MSDESSRALRYAKEFRHEVELRVEDTALEYTAATEAARIAADKLAKLKIQMRVVSIV